jgi:hypothetical protein
MADQVNPTDQKKRESKVKFIGKQEDKGTEPIPAPSQEKRKTFLGGSDAPRVHGP